MDHREAGALWDENAETWTHLARAGYDVYRDYLNTPAFLAMLPDVQGLQGLDIGCGEGSNTRRVAERGAQMQAIDISDVFIRHAREAERLAPLGIMYQVASAVKLPFPESHFDFATAFMSLMDVPETERVIAEAFRILKPGGFLQFSITHPCFDTPYRRNCRAEGRTYAIEIGDYFRRLEGEISEWIFRAEPRDWKFRLRPFRIPRFTRTLSTWLNWLLDAGFVIERLGEPRPSNEVVRAQPRLQDAQIVAYFLHVRVRKPTTGVNNALKK